MPAAEYDIDAALVRRLLADQFSYLAGLDIVEFSNGWDNVMFRLGDALTVRLPRRQVAAALIDNEQRCLEPLSPRLGVAVPATMHRGAPSSEFPLPWSICPWYAGVTASDATLADPAREAKRLGEFLVVLHRPAQNRCSRESLSGTGRSHHRAPVIDNVARLRRDDADDALWSRA